MYDSFNPILNEEKNGIQKMPNDFVTSFS